MDPTTNGRIICDYLVIGAGAAGLAFVDTLLTEQPSAKVVLVDKYAAPGGHWVHDYDFVHLHQPSLLYGVASKQLEGNWLGLLLGRRLLPWKHRASKREILRYFSEFVDEKVKCGQLRYYPECRYDFDQEIGSDDTHAFQSLKDEKKYAVHVKEKLVNGVLGECKIPSQCPVQFPVDEGIRLITPNQLPPPSKKSKKKKPEGPRRHYIVLGCGKTAMDTVVYLLRELRVAVGDISWVIPNDVWMTSREGPGGPWSYGRALLEADGDLEKACAQLEREGVFVRLDESITPTKFRFPVIGRDELELMRSVPAGQIVRRGRVTSITLDGDTIGVGFGDGQEDLRLPPSDGERVFVHCTSPGPFNGIEIERGELFVSSKELRLALLFAPPVSLSPSVQAKLESARRGGTLDVEFGRELLRAASPAGGECDDASVDDVLRQLILRFGRGEDVPSQLEDLSFLAVFLALVDRDPMVGYKWLKSNRLSFFSIPGFKSGIVDMMETLSVKGKELGLSEDKIGMFKLLHKKIEPLGDK